jgi:hypothetical protein
MTKNKFPHAMMQSTNGKYIWNHKKGYEHCGGEKKKYIYISGLLKPLKPKIM